MSSVADAELLPSVRDDPRLRAQVTMHLLRVCRHCKRQCRVCRVVYPIEFALKMNTFPAVGELADVCTLHLHHCPFCNKETIIAAGMPICDACLAHYFPVEVRPAIKTIFDLAKLLEDDPPLGTMLTDGRSFSLDEAVKVSARVWCEVIHDLMRPEAVDRKVYTAQHFPRLVDGLLPVVAPDIRLSIAGADRTSTGKIELKPADDRLPADMRATSPGLLFQRMRDFAANPRNHLIVPISAQHGRT